MRYLFDLSFVVCLRLPGADSLVCCLAQIASKRSEGVRTKSLACWVIMQNLSCWKPPASDPLILSLSLSLSLFVAFTFFSCSDRERNSWQRFSHVRSSFYKGQLPNPFTGPTAPPTPRHAASWGLGPPASAPSGFDLQRQWHLDTPHRRGRERNGTVVTFVR